jgi:hypothetical protein
MISLNFAFASATVQFCAPTLIPFQLKDRDSRYGHH